MKRHRDTPATSNSFLGLTVDPILRCLDAGSLGRLLDVRLDPAVKEQVSILADKANEGLLTDAERAEYEACIRADDFLSILKLKAKRLLSIANDSEPHGLESKMKSAKDL